MNTLPPDLIDQARSGAPEPFLQLVRALQGPDVAAAVLIDLARSPEVVLRRAAIQGARGRTDADVLAAVAGLAADPEALVRHTLAEALGETASWPLDRADGPLPRAVERLLRDDDEEVRLAAARAARRCPAAHATLLARLTQDEDWRVRRAVAEALTHAAPRIVLPPLVAALAGESDSDVSKAIAAAAEKHLAVLGGYPADLSRPAFTVLEQAQKRVAGSSACPPLLTAWLAERVAHDVDVEQLRGFGTLLTAGAEVDRLPHAYGVEGVGAARKAVLKRGPMSRTITDNLGEHMKTWTIILTPYILFLSICKTPLISLISLVAVWVMR